MRTIQSSEGQTLLDIAIEHCGDASIAIDIAILNGLDIDDLSLGQLMDVPDLVIDKKAVVNSFVSSNLIPASALEADNYIDEWTLYYTTGLPSSHL